jgi:hypothetical protein
MVFRSGDFIQRAGAGEEAVVLVGVAALDRLTVKRRGQDDDRCGCSSADGNPHLIGTRGKTRGGMILRFPGGRESDSFWECRGPEILTVCRTPS